MKMCLKNPIFVVSLDFEKMWGVFDKRTISTYGDNITNVELVIVRLLTLFEKYDIHCTWATVGMLFHKDIQSCKNIIPTLLPTYKDSKLSSYNHLNEIFTDNFNIYYSGLDSIILISNTPNQEIATHTYSHFYCLEEGSSVNAFFKDLEMSMNISKDNGFEIKSIVFPRNQYSTPFLEICSKLGIKAFRGTQKSWIHKTRSQTDLNILHRVLKFTDSYVNISGSNIYSSLEFDSSGLLNIPASFFFRPFNPNIRFLEPLKMKRFKNSMLKAAKQNSLFHLWWHPHNFGKNIDENFDQLETILNYFSELNREYGMESKTMMEVVHEYRKL